MPDLAAFQMVMVECYSVNLIHLRAYSIVLLQSSGCFFGMMGAMAQSRCGGRSTVEDWDGDFVAVFEKEDFPE